jgi:acyl-coenzyme A thioesterase PaaI-like protein
MEPGTGVLSIEFKINMLAPATGERFAAVGRVLRSGRTVTVCTGEAIALRDDGPVTVATMQATMMGVRREGVAD